MGRLSFGQIDGMEALKAEFNAQIPFLGHAMSKSQYCMSKKPSYLRAAVAFTLLAGCASSSEYSNAEYHVERREEARNFDCPGNETPACVERIGQLADCFCSSKDDLERLLEDPLYQEHP